MTYREPLPENCPPDEAEEIHVPRVVYRLVRNNPPTDDDFRSQLAERTDRIFRNITECQAHGLSIRTDLESTMELMRFRTMRGRMLCQVRLDNGAGRIMQTGEDPQPRHVVAIGGLRLSLEPQQGLLLEMDYLPEAGFRLGKTPADDLMSANPN